MRHRSRGRPGLPAWGAVAAMMLCPGAALADVGRRDFADTMLFDDPEPDDSLTFPGFSMQSFNGEADAPPTREYEIGFELEKRITSRLSLSLSDGYAIVTAPGLKTQTGFQSLVLGAKYEVIHSPTHEFVLSLGVQRLIGNTGAARLEAGQTGVTTPLLLFGKGFGDLQVDALRPLAVTGSFGYAIADRKLKATPITGGDDDDPAGTVFNKGLENRWVGGVSVQYSLLYMDAEVRHLNLPDWMIGLTPIVEVLWSSPASRPSREGTQWLIAPGLIWSNENWQFGIEALIPGNRASGRNVGVIAQLKIGLGVIAPRLGRPLF